MIAAPIYLVLKQWTRLGWPSALRARRGDPKFTWYDRLARETATSGRTEPSYRSMS
jgi:hypothetical protein